jgi:hypothetical protein
MYSSGGASSRWVRERIAVRLTAAFRLSRLDQWEVPDGTPGVVGNNVVSRTVPHLPCISDAEVCCAARSSSDLHELLLSLDLAADLRLGKGVDGPNASDYGRRRFLH